MLTVTTDYQPDTIGIWPSRSAFRNADKDIVIQVGPFTTMISVHEARALAEALMECAEAAERVPLKRAQEAAA